MNDGEAGQTGIKADSAHSQLIAISLSPASPLGPRAFFSSSAALPGGALSLRRLPQAASFYVRTSLDVASCEGHKGHKRLPAWRRTQWLSARMAEHNVRTVLDQDRQSCTGDSAVVLHAHLIMAASVGPAADPGYVSVETRPGGIAIVTVAKEPVNSMDLDMWMRLDQAIAGLEADPSITAVIIVSGLKKDVFSAGNDLMELYAPKTTSERYARFWVAQNAFLVRLHRSRLVTVAAIRGACPAGGCAISLCSDFRIMTPEGSMGLNEVQLGIPVPKFWGLLMGRVMGPKAAEDILLTGRMVLADEAKRVGLVDAVVPAEQLLAVALATAVQACKQPAAARAATKLLLREDFCTAWEAYFPTEPSFGWRFLSSPSTIAVLEGAMRRLSSKGGQKKPQQPAASKL
ncbi:Enoyl-CoA delta isomerase 1, mitochondrial [Tetrabaena socialis]|uniref:Enoyl-CoA delta isomerase 1, mitochondrial n=1 Tax=Tetrabaena socialis TaxID=47790 RepID=A0A2J8AA42_9CHLO|nr:Enoyl-CoA delta isomerase 1, mitochondrial [Tetrabaena socialis]|eukprot:PNH09389.1 Enoyl-CoA delta isomerase 1, mitochondrial [Tetrabaena socialis]